MTEAIDLTRALSGMPFSQLTMAKSQRYWQLWGHIQTVTVKHFNGHAWNQVEVGTSGFADMFLRTCDLTSAYMYLLEVLSDLSMHESESLCMIASILSYSWSLMIWLSNQISWVWIPPRLTNSAIYFANFGIRVNVNVNVDVYSLISLWVQKTFKSYTPGIGTLSYTVSSPLGRT